MRTPDLHVLHGTTAVESRCLLAKLERGRVPCVHAQSTAVTTCRFTPRSGKWFESTGRGIYAQAGQSISRDGREGGQYTIAARRGKSGKPPCAGEPNPRLWRMDTAAQPSATPLSEVCMLEESGLSEMSEPGELLVNYATLPVCTNTRTHPMCAPFVGMSPTGLYCFSGQGAGLNDVIGNERDIGGFYLSGVQYCHRLEINNAIVPAAYRPAYRPDGRIIPLALAWRPVMKDVSIAN